MPTYDYQCADGHSFEKIHKMSEKPRVTCPVCGKVASRQISGGAGLVFKGSGFYITDYGKDGKGARKPDAGEASSSSPAADAPAGKGAKPATPGSKASKSPSSKSSGVPKKAAE